MVVTRIVIGHFFFTDYELEALDDPLPKWGEIMRPPSPEGSNEEENVENNVSKKVVYVNDKDEPAKVRFEVSS